IVGSGPDREALERQAAGSAEFLGRLPDTDVRELYRRAGAVLLPGEEDFGIVPLEAQACGRPVVALARGGAVETVLDGETGALVGEAAPGAFAEAISRTIGRRFDPSAIRRHAEGFGRERFGNAIEAVVAAGAQA